MLAFCSCDASDLLALGGNFSPWGDKNVENSGNGDDGNVKKTYRIYVCGAVAREGYYEIDEGETYLSAIKQAGLLAHRSWLPINSNSVVDESCLSIVVWYMDSDTPRECYDANSIFLSLCDATYFDGLSDAVINKIADYLELHGKIPNKTVLLEVLGAEDYANYHYKLYIAEADYEEAD